MTIKITNLKKIKQKLKTKKIRDLIGDINSQPLSYDEKILNEFVNGEHNEIRKEYLSYDTKLSSIEFLEKICFKPLDKKSNNVKFYYSDDGTLWRNTSMLWKERLNFQENYKKLINEFIIILNLIPFSHEKNNPYVYHDVYYRNNTSLLRIRIGERIHGNGKYYPMIDIDYISNIENYYKYKQLFYELYYCGDEIKKDNSIFMIHETPLDGLILNPFPIESKKLDIINDYNDGLVEVDEILKNLTEDDSGLVLLHGNAGTGKSSYLNYICDINKEKRKVIYIPSNFLPLLNTSKFHDLLNDNRNSIFVLEDSEQILVSRDNTRNEMVQTLLNFTDGFMADIFKPIFICTFNVDVSKIDSALLRKGRCIAKYEFKDLEATKAQALSNRLGFNTVITKPMKLADIYNQDEKDHTPQNRKVIGFSTSKSA